MNRKDLKEYRNKELNIKSEQETLKEQFARLTGTTQIMDGLPKTHNNTNYAMEAYLDKKAKIDKEILEQNNLYLNEIRDRFNKLKPIYATILREYYIKAKSLEEVAITIDRSYYRTCHLNGNALDEFDKLEKK